MPRHGAGKVERVMRIESNSYVVELERFSR